MNPSKPATIATLEAELRGITNFEERAREERIALEGKLKRVRARGTGDHVEAARAATALAAYFVGDEADGPTCVAAIERVIKDRPRTLMEIVELTGIRRNRVSGFINRLQVSGKNVVNTGDKYRAVWWLSPKRPTIAR